MRRLIGMMIVTLSVSLLAQVPASGSEVALQYCRDQTYRAVCSGSSVSRVERHAHRSARRGSVEARVERSALVRGINAKLVRWVRPTGKCGLGESEQLATYYNSGRVTATGARFNPRGMTAAHRTLPFGTRLNITNPHTGRSVSVVINDRGPYTIAKIDLTSGAASAIGMRSSIYVCVSGASYAEN